MKKIVLSAAAVFAMSSFAIAGGDIAPVQEPAVEVPAVAEAAWTPAFYVGAAYVNVTADATDELGREAQITGDNYALAAGLVVNKYLAIEGRYSNSLSDPELDHLDGKTYDLNGDIEVLAIFAKPMYAVTDQFVVYGLLGYANVLSEDGDNVIHPDRNDVLDEDGFAWGLGAAYAVTPNVLVFADWTRLYDDTIDNAQVALNTLEVTVDTINVGVAYVF